MMGTAQIRSENRHIASIGFHTVTEGFPTPEEFQNRIMVDLGAGRVDTGRSIVDNTDIFAEYVRSLCKPVLAWEDIRHNQERLAMTPEAVLKF